METIIFHIDVNSAFLSWTSAEMIEEARARGETIVDPRTVPSVIGGDISTRHGIVVAKSIPARKYGIETAEPIVSAMRKCPNLLVISPNHLLYKRRSKELMNYLRTISPDIEQVSIDECYMDFTRVADRYESPEQAAGLIRKTIRETMGFTVNVGISDRKVLAKMASDFEKPDRTHTLYHTEIEQKMWPLPVGDLFMCGKSAAATLNKLGIRTIGDLAGTDVSILSAHLKSHGIMLHNFANGIDNSPVTSVREPAKGVGNSVTMSEDVTSAVIAKGILKELSSKVAGRLQKSQKLAEMVSVEIKYSTFQSISHQMTTDATDNADTIHKCACELFDEIWSGQPVRLLGIRTSKLMDKGEPVQLSIFNYLEESEKEEKKKKLDQAFAGLRKKYGDDVIQHHPQD